MKNLLQKLLRFLFFAIVFIGCSSTERTNNPEVIVKAGLGENIDTYFSSLEPFGLCGSFLFAKGDSIIYQKAFGLSNREEKIHNGTNSLFSIGSITKQFTSSAILKLEMDKQLTTDAVLSDFFENIPIDKQSISLHHLLTHTSGFPLYVKENDDFQKTSKSEMLKILWDTPLAFIPGEKYQYSNAGYSLLAAIIEKVTGKGYEQYIHSQLFGPAGMKNTGYKLAEWKHMTESHNYIDEKDYNTFQSRNFVNWNLIGNGALLSTTSDMFKWYLTLKSNKVLSASTREKLFTPFLEDYAYGWEVYDNGEIIEHSGGGLGNNALFLWYPKEDIVFIGLSNCAFDGIDMIDYFYDDIETLIFGEVPKTADEIANIPQQDYKNFVGTYLLPSGEVIELKSTSNGLKLISNSQDGINLLNFSDQYRTGLFTGENKTTFDLYKAAVEKKDYTKLAALVDNPERLPKLQNSIQTRLKDYGFQHPIVHPYRTDNLYGKLRSFVVVTEKGQKIELLEDTFFFSIVWKDGQYDGIGRTIMPVSPVVYYFVPVSKNELVGYNFSNKNQAKIKLTFSETGKNIINMNINGNKLTVEKL